MSSKILLAIVAFVAGAATVYGYQMITANLQASRNQDEEMRLAEIERQLNDMRGEVEEVKAAQHNTDSDTQTLSSRVTVLDGLFSRLDKEQVKSAPPASEAGNSNPSSSAVDSNRNLPGAKVQERLSGEELAEALRELPEDGRKALRRAIHEEIQRMRDESKPVLESKEELEKKGKASITSLTAALSLTPIQVQQTTDIVARQIDEILKSQRIAKETGDLSYAQTARVKIRRVAERELVDILTPEQMDKLRELDPEGFGKRYPRGF